MQDVLTIHDLARLFGKAPDTLRKTLPDMIGNEGFPSPFTETGTRLWHRDHLLAWIDRKLEAGQRERVADMRGCGRSADDGDDVVVAFQRHLDDKYGRAG